MLRVVWAKFKDRGLSVLAAWLIFAGIHQTFSGITFPLSGWILKGLNALIRQSLRDQLPLRNNYLGIPWQYHAGIVAQGAIIAVVGMFFGLWVNRRTRPLVFEQQSPRQ